MLWLPALVLAATMLQQPDPAAEGMKALDQQRWDDAVTLFTRAAAADPKDYSNHFHLALALSMLNRDAEAIAEYKKVIEIKQDVAPALVNLGAVLLRQKRPAEAVAYLESAVKLKPNDIRAAMLLGDALLGSGEAVKAEAAYTAALNLDPKRAAAEAALARALMAQKRTDEAAGHLKKAGELGDQDALLELAAVYEQQHKAAEAISIYERFPNIPGAQERLGELLLEAGKPAEAIPHLEDAVAKSPTPANRYALATAYVANKNPEKAAPVLEKAVAEEPANVELRMTYARALREQKNYSAAASQFYKAAQLKPDDAQAWSDLAGMLILTENYPQALAALDKVRALGAETAAHHYFRAIVLDKFHQVKPALESYQKFLAMSNGKNPDEEFKARQRVRILERELSKR